MDSIEHPAWVDTLAEKIASGIEFKGMADIAWRYFDPEGTSWGIDVLEIAPALMDLSELGEESGELGYGIIHNLDLMHAQQAFDEVESLSYGVEEDGKSCITIEGKVDERDVAVLIYSEPFDDPEDGAEEEDDD